MKVSNEKRFSFHGEAMSSELALLIQKKWDKIALVKDAKRLVMRRLKATMYYYADMDHYYQKYHEEDALVAVLDVMALDGWKFKFQYDSEMSSNKVVGASFSRREMFVFQK